MLARVHRAVALSFVLFTTGVGCGGARYAEPIASFSGSIAESGVVIGTYYTELNKAERDNYLDDILYSGERVATTDKSGVRTPLLGQFSAESIKARRDSIALLGAYAEKLAALAGSDAPATFATGAEKLGDNLVKLDATFRSLAANKDTPDANASAYTAPISKLAGVVGKLYLEIVREQAVQLAVKDGAPTVRIILDLLEKDFTTVIVPLQQTGLKAKLAARIVYYNDHTAEPTPARRLMLAEIAEIAGQYERTLTADPVNLISSMRSAHEALVVYAGSDKSPQSFAAFVTAADSFRNNVKQIAEPVLALKALKEGK